MHVFVEIGPLKAYLKHHQSSHFSIGLVPTMGALHRGHISLIEASKKQNSITICSIYVNPVQFNNAMDLEKYPRTLDHDLRMLEEAGCDVVFCPSNSEMYPAASQLKFDFGSLDKILEGEFRPGHFSGVALVVSKLFNITQPQRAYFGQKDFQQFKIISRLAEELKFDLELICAPIIRENDGLAMSSRNTRLTMEERKRAVVLSQSLIQSRDKLLFGEHFSDVRNFVIDKCREKNLKIEYFAIADRENFALLENVIDAKRTIILVAAYVGEVRLIDNLFLEEN
jgi:pantoate--beta-alanine ligase